MGSPAQLTMVVAPQLFPNSATQINPDHSSSSPRHLSGLRDLSEERNRDALFMGSEHITVSSPFRLVLAPSTSIALRPVVLCRTAAEGRGLKSSLLEPVPPYHCCGLSTSRAGEVPAPQLHCGQVELREVSQGGGPAPPAALLTLQL